MNFYDAMITEDLNIDSGDKALDKLFKKYLSEVYSPMFLKKINRVYDMTMHFKMFKERSNVMCYTKGNNVYVNKPLFTSTPISKSMNYIMHEIMHVFMNSGKFPELKSVGGNLLAIITQMVPRGKESDFLTGKHQNIHSDWRNETLTYLCNDSVDWDIAAMGAKMAYKSVLKDSGIFNMSSSFWKKRFGDTEDLT